MTTTATTGETLANLVAELDHLAEPPRPDVDGQRARLRHNREAIRALEVLLDEQLAERTRLFVNLRAADPPVLFTALAEDAGLTDGRVMQVVKKATV